MRIDPLSRQFLHGSGQHGPLVLMYHGVSLGRSRPKWPWSVSLQRFVQQLELLQAFGWVTIGPHELNDSMTSHIRAVVLTFDDGYADNYAAFKALTERGMTASWYIVSDHIGKLASWAKPPDPCVPLLNPTQLCEMAAAGMAIGSHGCSHCRLTEIDDVKLARELGDSKKNLEDILGQEVWHFAYPYGQFDDRVVAAVRHAGYRMAFTTRTGWAMRDRDPYRIRRVPIFGSDTLSSFARKLAWADSDVSWTRLTAYYASRIRSRLSRRVDGT